MFTMDDATLTSGAFTVDLRALDQTADGAAKDARQLRLTLASMRKELSDLHIELAKIRKGPQAETAKRLGMVWCCGKVAKCVGHDYNRHLSYYLCCECNTRYELGIMP